MGFSKKTTFVKCPVTLYATQMCCGFQTTGGRMKGRRGAEKGAEEGRRGREERGGRGRQW